MGSMDKFLLTFDHTIADTAYMVARDIVNSLETLVFRKDNYRISYETKIARRETLALRRDSTQDYMEGVLSD